MKKKLKGKYLSVDYHQDIELQFKNFYQQDSSVNEHSIKFVNLIIKGDWQEAKEICIA